MANTQFFCYLSSPHRADASFDAAKLNLNGEDRPSSRDLTRRSGIIIHDSLLPFCLRRLKARILKAISIVSYGNSIRI